MNFRDGTGKNFIRNDVKKKERRERDGVCGDGKLADLFSEGFLGIAYIISFSKYIKRQSHKLVTHYS